MVLGRHVGGLYWQFSNMGLTDWELERFGYHLSYKVRMSEELEIQLLKRALEVGPLRQKKTNAEIYLSLT